MWWLTGIAGTLLTTYLYKKKIIFNINILLCSLYDYYIVNFNLHFMQSLLFYVE